MNEKYFQHHSPRQRILVAAATLAVAAVSWGPAGEAVSYIRHDLKNNLEDVLEFGREDNASTARGSAIGFAAIECVKGHGEIGIERVNPSTTEGEASEVVISSKKDESVDTKAIEACIHAISGHEALMVRTTPTPDRPRHLSSFGKLVGELFKTK